MFIELFKSNNSSSLLQKLQKTQSSSSNGKNKNEVDLLESFATDCNLLTENLNTDNKQISISDEILFYKSAVNSKKHKFNEFWLTHHAKLPQLSSLVKRINIIPASSVPSESKFSIAGYINRKERSSLSTSNLRYSMCLNDKHKLENIEFNK